MKKTRYFKFFVCVKIIKNCFISCEMICIFNSETPFNFEF